MIPSRSLDPLRVVSADGRPADVLRWLWGPNPAFLVGGGPSLRDVDLGRLRERGVCSLGVNQAAAFAPVRAWCFSDSQTKFCSSLFLDPSIRTFAPTPKLRKHFSFKTVDGFRRSSIRVRDCPNTWGFDRRTCFVPRTFLTDEFAHWGPGKWQPPNEPKIGCLCTMLLGLRLLHWLGVRRIYLIGVDHCGRDNLCYGFACDKRERNKRYKWERQMLESLQPIFADTGVEIFNCSPASRLDLYLHVPFEDAIQDCKGSVESEPLDTTLWYSLSIVNEQSAAHEPITPRHY